MNILSIARTTLTVVIVAALLFGIGSHAWTADNPEKPLPWSDSLSSFEKATYHMVSDIAQSAIRAFGRLTVGLDTAAEWCGTPSVCANKIIKAAEAYAATFLLAAYTWVGVHIIERLPKAAFGQ